MSANTHVPGIPPALHTLDEQGLCAYYNAIDARYADLMSKRDTPRPAVETPSDARDPDVSSQKESTAAHPL
jgi:hypothetical protein